MANMADDLPFRSQAESTRTGVAPVGALLPFRERGQTAPGGASLGDSVGGPDALGTGSNSTALPVKLGR